MLVEGQSVLFSYSDDEPRHIYYGTNGSADGYGGCWSVDGEYIFSLKSEKLEIRHRQCYAHACSYNPEIVFYNIRSSQLHLYPIPRSPSLRHNYIPNEEVFVAYLCQHGTIFHRGSVWKAPVVGSKTCEIIFDGMRREDVLFEHIYSNKWWVLHARCRKAVYTILLCTKSLSSLRDVGTIVARYVWATRDEQEWEN